MNKKQRDRIVEKRITFTKRWTAILLTMSVIWITLSYVLAFMGKENIAETLSENVMAVIIATFIPYLCKSYFETFASEKNRLKEKEMESNEVKEEATDYNEYILK